MPLTLLENQFKYDYKWLTGVFSVHDNHREDRRFQWRYVEPADSSLSLQMATGKTSSDWTEFDAEWTFECDENEAIIGMESENNPSYLSLSFTLDGCAISVRGQQLIRMQSFSWWLSWPRSNTDNLTAQLSSMCFLAGKSAKSLPRRVFGCSVSDFADYWLTQRSYSGQSSCPIIRRTDQLCSWPTCWEQSAKTADQQTSPLTAHSSRNCSPKGSCVDGAFFEFCGGKKDRRWKFTCGKLPAPMFGLSDCGWSGYANNYDKNLKFECPNDGVITGLVFCCYLEFSFSECSWNSSEITKCDFYFPCCSGAQCSDSIHFQNFSIWFPCHSQVFGAGTTTTARTGSSDSTAVKCIDRVFVTNIPNNSTVSNIDKQCFYPLQLDVVTEISRTLLFDPW